MLTLFKKYKIPLVITGFIVLGFIIALVFNTKFSANQDAPFSTSKLNILIAGYDSSINGPPRADTVIVASIDLKTKEAGILFIPRDTRLQIPNNGIDRVNAAHAYGGIELLQETLESFLDVPMDYYLETDFNGFARIIDLLGGITINIERHLQYTDEAANLEIDLAAGKQLLSGEEALHYVRYREPIRGDIGRVARQQKFVKAIMNKFKNPEIIVKLPSLLNEIFKSVKTNIPLQDISPFIHLIKEMNINQIETAMVPGVPRYIGGASYWVVNEDELQILVDNIIRSKEYINNSNIHLFLYNGNGGKGVAHQLARQLSKYGFKIDEIDNAPHFNYEETIITYFDTRDKLIARGIQEVIGGKIRYERRDRQGIKIIIGANYMEDIDT